MAAPTNAANVKKALANSEPFHTWHKVDLLRSHTDVRLLRQTGKHLLRVSFSPSDP
jgi:hypothetical protein